MLKESSRKAVSVTIALMDNIASSVLKWVILSGVKTYSGRLLHSIFFLHNFIIIVVVMEIALKIAEPEEETDGLFILSGVLLIFCSFQFMQSILSTMCMEDVIVHAWPENNI